MDACSRLQEVHSLVYDIVFLLRSWNAWKLIRIVKFGFFFPCDIFIDRVWSTCTVAYCKHFRIIVESLTADLNLARFMRILASPYHNISLIVSLLDWFTSEKVLFVLILIDMLHEVVFVVSINLRHLSLISLNVVRVHRATSGTVNPHFFTNQPWILQFGEKLLIHVLEIHRLRRFLRGLNLLLLYLCLFFYFIQCICLVLLFLSIVEIIEHGLISLTINQRLWLMAVSHRLLGRHQNLFIFKRGCVNQIIFDLF